MKYFPGGDDRRLHDHRTDRVFSAVAAQAPAAEAAPRVSLIICTLNEAGSIGGVLREAVAVLAPFSHEIIVVDDSTDDQTADVVRAFAAVDASVRLLRRQGERGLASAVIAGWDIARGQRLAVCDGDGQHDLSLLPAMLGLIDERDLDLVAASRYIRGETGLQGRRKMMSGVATRVTTGLLGVSLTDPLSGYFVISRDYFKAARAKLSGVGFKILLDVACSARRRPRTAEVPTALRGRTSGESKLDFRVIADLGALLIDKRTNGFLSARFVMFAAVGLSGIVVHMLVLKLLKEAGPFALAQAGAILLAMTWNFWFNNILTFRDMRLRGRAMWQGLVTFYAACLGGGIISEVVASLMHSQHINWMVAGGSGAILGGLWNYFASKRATWNGRRAETRATLDAQPVPQGVEDQ